MCFIVCVGLKKSTWNKIGNVAGTVLAVAGTAAQAVPGIGTAVGGAAIAGGGLLVSRSPVPSGKTGKGVGIGAAAQSPNAGPSNQVANAADTTSKNSALVIGGIILLAFIILVVLVRR